MNLNMNTNVNGLGNPDCSKLRSIYIHTYIHIYIHAHNVLSAEL